MSAGKITGRCAVRRPISLPRVSQISASTFWTSIGLALGVIGCAIQFAYPLYQRLALRACHKCAECGPQEGIRTAECRR